MKTFPKIEDQINFVYHGTAGYQGEAYGNPARGRVGGVKGQMPTQATKLGGALSDAEIVAVICHERYGSVGGVDAASAAKPEYVKEAEEWCTAGGAKWLEVEEGGLAKAGVDIGIKKDW